MVRNWWSASVSNWWSSHVLCRRHNMHPVCGRHLRARCEQLHVPAVCSGNVWCISNQRLFFMHALCEWDIFGLRLAWGQPGVPCMSCWQVLGAVCWSIGELFSALCCAHDLMQFVKACQRSHVQSCVWIMGSLYPHCMASQIRFVIIMWQASSALRVILNMCNCATWYTCVCACVRGYATVCVFDVYVIYIYIYVYIYIDIYIHINPTCLRPNHHRHVSDLRDQVKV